jgi:protein TonB
MKRLLPAAGLAVLIHALILSLHPDWRQNHGPGEATVKTVTFLLDPPMPAVSRTQAISTPPAPKLLEPEPVKAKMPTPLPPRVKAVARSKPDVTPPKKATRAQKPVPQPTPAPAPFGDFFSSRRPNERPAPDEAAPESSPENADSAARGGPHSPPSADPATASASRAESTAKAPLRLASPEYNRNPPIAYPSRARRRGYEGTVVLEVLVNQQGRVDDLRVITSSGHSILDRSALENVRAWSFKPARRGEQAIAMWVQVPVRFNLK